MRVRVCRENPPTLPLPHNGGRAGVEVAEVAEGHKGPPYPNSIMGIFIPRGETRFMITAKETLAALVELGA